MYKQILENISRQCTSQTKDNAIIGDDGLPHCKVCGDLLVTEEVIPVFNKRMPVVCSCFKEREQAEKEQKALQRKLNTVNELRKASLLGEKYKDVTFRTCDMSVDKSFQNTMQRCKKFCEISDEVLVNGYGMYIYGASGVGKTHLTACMCNELISQCRQCLFTNFFEISKMIRSTFNRNSDSEATIKKISKVDFLFLDDLGTERLKKGNEDMWLQEQVYDIINARYNNRKPTIFTSNYSLNELITERGMMEKTVDRILEMSTAIIKVTGQSYRQKNRPKQTPF